MPLSLIMLYFQPRNNKKQEFERHSQWQIDSVFAEKFVFTEGVEDGSFQWGIDEVIKMSADKQVLPTLF